MKNTTEETNAPRKPTEAQINANRENAKKSSGPKTAAGKAASSRNRLLHGLRAHKHILLDEDPAEFILLIHDHFDRFQPVGPSEEKLVLRLAADQWRRYRALPAEAGIYRDRFNDVAHKDKYRLKAWATEKESAEEDGDPVPPPPGIDEGDLLARAFIVDCEGANSFARLARYESSIERSIDRCLRQLKTYQGARIASTPPADLDPPVDGEPEVEQPEVGHAVPPAPSAEMPAATPSNDANYHSNPKNEGIAKFSAAAMALMVYALLSAVPELIAMIASLLTGPRAAWLQKRCGAGLQACAGSLRTRSSANAIIHHQRPSPSRRRAPRVPVLPM